MASSQGICKNCGSLIMLNDREELCECLFCDCVFPTEEALKIAQNPKEYTFPNEPQPKREGNKRYTMTPVYADPIPAAVKHAEALAPIVVEKNPYEVSPDDVKAPLKTILVIIGAVVAVIVLVIAIAWPLYAARTSHTKEITAEIGDRVFTEFTVDAKEEDGYFNAFAITGQRNEKIVVSTDDEDVTEEDVLTTFMNYAELRAETYGISESDFSDYYGVVSLTVYTPTKSYSMSIDKKSELNTDHVSVTSADE